MAKNQESRAYDAAPSGSLWDNTNRHGHTNAIIPQIQPFPVPGTALTAFLRRYRQELLTADRTRETSMLIECCDVLLFAAAGLGVRR